MASLDSIDHFVVLMLENRSFDNLLGALRQPSAQYNGLTGAEVNFDRDGAPLRATEIDKNAPLSSLNAPKDDPGERWTEMNLQLFGRDQLDAKGAPKSGAIPKMNGFVDSYTDPNRDPPPPNDLKSDEIMKYYQTSAHLKAMATLANQFMVCDCWFASAPCQTWPNRFFVHAASAAGYENNEPGPVLEHVSQSNMQTIYDLFDRVGKGNDWAIFHHGVAQSLVLPRLIPQRAENFHLFDRFVEKAQAGTLPSYSFIEPRYYAAPAGFPTLIDAPNDQHPPHNVIFGDQLVAMTYNALRKSESAWKKTMLIIIYDEHGGCFDHAPPGPATPPGDENEKWHKQDAPFKFDRFGARVPAIIASPYVAQGSVLRPSDNYPDDKTTPFDHTSVISTLCKRFGLPGPLTNRDKAAPTLERALTLDQPSNLGPEQIAALEFTLSLPEKLKALFEPWDDFRRSLHDAARHFAQGPDAIDHGRAQIHLDRHVTTTDPKANDHVQSDAGAIAARLLHSVLTTIGLRK